ncbi:MAG TPA: hypothetical protein VF531_11890 [Bacillota bacterium]
METIKGAIGVIASLHLSWLTLYKIGNTWYNKFKISGKGGIFAMGDKSPKNSEKLKKNADKKTKK